MSQVMSRTSGKPPSSKASSLRSHVFKIKHMLNHERKVRMELIELFGIGNGETAWRDQESETNIRNFLSD